MKLNQTFIEERNQVQAEDGIKYPAKCMADMTQAPAFDRAKNHMLQHIRTINEAHLIMLKEQNILSESDAVAIMKALESLDYEKYRFSTYTGKVEDIYFEMESELIERTHGVAGNLHLGRSRNDMCLTWVHMMIRDHLLKTIELMIRVRNTLYLLGEEHKNTLYVIHTHTQHAQPGMIGIYFLAAGDMLGRDIDRLKNAYAHVNSSPMGAAAITTTGFPISRQRVAELSGFDSVLENSYDAISNMDLFTDTGAALSHCALDLSRIIADLVLWATEEEDMIRLADGYISISSIMPQKRNPIALEHLRSALSVTKGFADSMSLAFFKSPYGDIVDHDGAEDALLSTFEKLQECLTLFNNVIATMEINRPLLYERAFESFSVVTEIADEMFRAYNIPFREAHHFVSYMVRKALSVHFNLKNITPEFFSECFEEVFHRPFTFDFEPILKAINPERFVASREVYGGTGPKAMQAMIESARTKIKDNAAWLETAQARIAQSDARRAEAIQEMLA